MTTTKKTIEFSAKNVKPFTNWLKRFASIGNSLLLEIDEKTSTFIAKTYDDERSIVKMSEIKFDDAGLTTKLDKEPKRIKVGIYNILRLIKIFDQFSDMEFNIIIQYQDLISDNVTQYAAEKINLSNKNLKMNVDCTSLNIFKYISDDLFKNSIAKIDIIGSFELTKSHLEKINSLSALDNEHNRIEFKFKDNKVYVSGKVFEYLVEEKTDSELKDTSLSVFKEQYSNVDIENYVVELGEDRLVFRSKDSDTICVTSKTTQDE
jgi:hypothetical protein